MVKQVFNKLVRDKIPDIISSKWETPHIRIADEKEYWIKLKEKLVEEVWEFLKDENMEELADVLEVIQAIKKHKNFNDELLETLRQEKEETRGWFYNKIILESTE